MSEKRFTLEQWTEESLYFSDGEYSAHMSIGYICKEVEKKLNEQQATIEQQEQSITILKQEIADTQAILEMLSEKLKGWNNE